MQQHQQQQQQQQQQPHYAQPMSQQTAGQNAYYETPYATPQGQYSAPPQPMAANNNNNNNNNNDWYTASPIQSTGSHGAGTIAPPQASALQAMRMPSLAPPVYTSVQSPVSLSGPYIMEGSMDASGRGGGGMPLPPGPFPQTFIPQAHMASNTNAGGSSGYTNEYYGGKDLDEPSLLEELGINVEHILAKTKAVVVPFRRFHKQSALADPSMIVEDADLAGPIAFALLLGGELLLTGKLQFGYIYGFGLFGCFSMTVILNLMSPTAVSFWTVTSILGYALIPVNILAAVKILLFSWGSALVRFWAVWTVVWSTTASTRLLEIGCGMEHQRYLLAYPIALLYSAFVLITIF
jgi:protein YIPF5/7